MTHAEEMQVSESSKVRRARGWLFAGVVAALLLTMLAAVLVVLYARGGGPVPAQLAGLSPKPQADVLARSDAPETVLRTLRLAGVDDAVVGDDGGTAVLRLEVPVRSAADVELAWETGFAAMAPAYPTASRYVVQVFASPDGTATAGGVAPAPTALVEVAVPGAQARSAVKADDASVLRRAATFRYLSRLEAAK